MSDETKMQLGLANWTPPGQQLQQQQTPMTGGLEPQPHLFGIPEMPRNAPSQQLHGHARALQRPAFTPKPQSNGYSGPMQTYDGHSYQPNPQGFGTMGARTSAGGAVQAPYLGYNLPYLERTLAHALSMQAQGINTGIATPAMIAMRQRQIAALQPGGANYDDPRRVASSAEQFQTSALARLAQSPQPGSSAVQNLLAAWGAPKDSSTGR